MASSGMILLPPAPDVCQDCATAHEPTAPHNQQSIYYQMAFYGRHGRWPTWDDALAHCDDQTHEAWAAGLREHGIAVAPRAS